jgi:hypothetical protein
MLLISPKVLLLKAQRPASRFGEALNYYAL